MGNTKNNFLFLYFKYLVVKKSKFGFFLVIWWCWIRKKYFCLTWSKIPVGIHGTKIVFFGFCDFYGFLKIFLKIWFLIRNQHKILSFKGFRIDPIRFWLLNNSLVLNGTFCFFGSLKVLGLLILTKNISFD